MQVQIVKNGQVVAVLDLSPERTFASGSRGFYAGGKVTIDGKRYQVSMPLTEIGSKPGSSNRKSA